MKALSMFDILIELTQEDYNIVAPRLAFATPYEGVVLAMIANDQRDAQLMQWHMRNRETWSPAMRISITN